MRNYFNYFTEIEERFQQRRGSLLMLSTLDWVLIESWRDAGLPLEVVLRGIDAAFDRFEVRQQRSEAGGKGRLRRVNGLAWCAQAVLESAEQAARASLAGPSDAVAAPPADTGFESDRIVRFLCSNAEVLGTIHLPESTAAAILVETANRLRVLAAEREPASGSSGALEELDRALTSLEERLVAALQTATPEPELLALREQGARELAPYRSRMGAVQVRQLQQQFLQKRLLERYRIPRLSLFYMGMA